jgi:type I restriction enzyme S subunit
MEFSEADGAEFTIIDGDILICEGGDVGRTAVWRNGQKEIYFQKALHRVRLNPNIALPDYVQYYMWFMANNGGFRDFINSVTIPHLTGVKLKKLPFPKTPLEVQQKFAAIVEKVEQQKARMREHLAELDALFASLQHRAFNGEL